MSHRQEQYERAVVGILLNHSEAAAKHEMRPEWFEWQRPVIDAFFRLIARGMEPDILSLAEAMGDAMALASLHHIRSSEAAAVSNLSAYLDSLRDMYTTRQLSEALDNAQRAIEGGEQSREVVGRLLQDALQTMGGDAKQYSYTARQALGLLVDHIETVFEARDSGGIGLKTGIAGVDSAMGGMHPSDLVVVGARPGVGKTAFGLSVMAHLLKQGKRVGFVSTEMSAIQVMSRLMSAETGISGHSLRDASLADADFTRISAAANSMHAWPIRIYDKPNVTIADVMLQCKAWAVDGGVDFIVIDYLTRVKPVRSSSNQVQDVGDVVTGIKNIARQLEVPVMCLAQLNRKSADRADKRPMMSDLRDSGVIEQEADQILMLWRGTGDEEGQAEVLIEKNRHGQCGFSRCHFVANTMQWRDVPHDAEYF